MEIPFFKHRIYFETSFRLPDDIVRSTLQQCINSATSTNFPIFLSVLTRDEKSEYKTKELEKKAILELEDIQGESIQDIHQQIINLCRDDYKNGFRIFFAVVRSDDKESFYLVIHAHHGIADGFMVTSFVQSVYNLYNNKNALPLRFVEPSSIINHQHLSYPSSWNTENLKQSVEQTLSTLPFPSTSPSYQTIRDTTEFHNTSRIIDSAASQRASTTAKNYGSLYNVNGCIHGMLIDCFTRSLIHSEGITEGCMTMNTITNLRRYLKETGDLSPWLFVSSFPVSIDISKLLSHEENCATLQRKVTQSLEEGLPLAIFLSNQEGRSDCGEEEKRKNCLETEISNLGLHPKECFTRSLITQIIYDNEDLAVQTISLVVWTDLDKQIHLCGACDGKFMTKGRFDEIMDGIVREIVEFGVV